MNSAAKSLGTLFCASLIAMLAFGCADRGPTNLYSKPLFNQSQAGAQMSFDGNDSYLVAGTPTVLSLAIKNTGNGSTVGPITGSVSLTSTSCAVLGTVTASFGKSGQVINPGDVVYGTPMTVDFSACSGAEAFFALTMKDSRGSTWVDGFSTNGQ